MAKKGTAPKKGTVQSWLDKFGLSITLKPPFAEVKWQPRTDDQDAAWDLYIEMVTRIITQPLPDHDGDEKAALDSVASLFGTTREVLKARGRKAEQFAKIAVLVLNQIVRPFTARWHKKSLAGAFKTPEGCKEFRSELTALQGQLTSYVAALADLAGVEDLQHAAK